MDVPLRDSLPINPRYEGWIAAAYDAWIPVGTVFPGDEELLAVLAAAPTPALELGCGTGRFLLRALAAGHRIDGLDEAPDMLDRCRTNAERAGRAPQLHLGDLAALDLDQRFGAIVCPAGTFTLVDDPGRAARALARCHDHLTPGGVLALALYTIEPPRRPYEWRLRRTGTGPDGTTYVVHEAVGWDGGRRVEVSYQRNERYDPDGCLVDTVLRVHHLRSWTRESIGSALAGAGYGRVEHRGEGSSWVTVATRYR